MPIRFFRSTTDALSTAPRADSLVELPANSIDPDPARGWFRRILPLLRNHPRVVSLSLIGLALDNLGVYGLPLVVRSAMDDALVGRTRPLMPFLWLMLAIVLMRLFGDRLHRRNIIATGVLLEYDMRVLIQDHLGRMPFEFHDEAETGQIISRANEDVAVIQQLLSFAPNMAIMYVGSVTILIWMMRVHLGLALVVLATLPLLVFLSIRMRAVMYPVAWLIQARSADIATIVEENVAGAHVVRAMSAEEDQIRRLDVASRRLRWAAEREIGYRATFEPLMQGLPRMTVAGVLLIGGWLAATGSLTIGTLVLFTTYIAHLQGSLGMLGFIVMIGQRARAASGRIFQLLDTQPTIVDSPQAIDLDFPRGDVRFEDVAFGYGHEEPLLRGLNLHIPPGEKLAIVGATGSGKSTVGKLVPRFYDVSAGRILIDDVDIRALSLASLRAHVGIVMDEAFLFTTTIHANIAYARPDATVSEVHAAADAAGAVSFIEDLPDGFDTVVGERGFTLSGGQRQRIAIARALIQNPRILILDDATSAIDVTVEQQIHHGLEKLLESRTTLLIAHRSATIALADRVAFIEDGKVVATGTHSELLSREPRYAAVLAESEADSSQGSTSPVTSRADDTEGPL